MCVFVSLLASLFPCFLVSVFVCVCVCVCECAAALAVVAVVLVSVVGVVHVCCFVLCMCKCQTFRDDFSKLFDAAIHEFGIYDCLWFPDAGRV